MIYHEFQDMKLSALGMGNMRLPVVDGFNFVPALSFSLDLPYSFIFRYTIRLLLLKALK